MLYNALLMPFAGVNTPYANAKKVRKAAALSSFSTSTKLPPYHNKIPKTPMPKNSLRGLDKFIRLIKLFDSLNKR